MTKVFISYQWNSKEVATKINVRLKSDGFETWFDDDRMNRDMNGGGRGINKAIEDGINNCNVFLSFITNDYCISQYCRQELNYAFERRKKHLYIKLELINDANSNGISFAMSGIYQLQAHQEPNCLKDWSDDLYNKLLNGIKAAINDEPFCGDDL